MCQANTRELFKNVERKRSEIINMMLMWRAKDSNRRMLSEMEVEDGNAFRS